MSINSSDFSKQGVNYSLHSEPRSKEELMALREANAKVVQDTADSNKTSRDTNNSKSFGSSVKVEESDIESINEKMSQLNVQLNFEMTEDRDRNIIKVLDQATGDVVRQIPTEDFLRMSERIEAIMSELQEVQGDLSNTEMKGAFVNSEV